MKMARNLNYRQEALLEDHHEVVLQAAYAGGPPGGPSRGGLQAVHHGGPPGGPSRGGPQAVHHEGPPRGQVDRRHHLDQVVHQEVLHEVT